ncbi:MAG: N-acetylmuramoyl-L-alanine amidase [Cyclobacteriaceae bacterium]
MRVLIFCVISVALVFFEYSDAGAQGPVPDTVIAQSGEGIFALLRRTDRNPSDYLPDFIELNRERLGNDSSLVLGKAYLLPPYPDHKSVPSDETPETFGIKYSEIQPVDEKLKGNVYYLVAGHSGPDPGAIGKYGPYRLSEDEYAYDVTLRLARRLMEHGATVYMIVQDENDGIRDTPILEMDNDEVHYPRDAIPYNQRARLKERVSRINELYVKHKGAYQRMLAIHIDSRSQSENIDVFFYHHGNSRNGEKLASSIHNTFTSKYRKHQPNRNYYGSVKPRSSLYVIKYSYPPTVFIELGNIKNEKDQRRFVIPDNRQALDNWICQGILSDAVSSQ